MTARTVSARDLETMAHAAHADIELPGPEGGWATATINGREYRARVGAVAVEREGCYCTELCSMGPTCPGGMLAGVPGAGCWRTGES